MKELFKLIHLIAPYLVIPILAAGIFRWKHLNTPLRIYIVGAALSTIVALLRTPLGHTNITFYISALLGVTVYGLLFQAVLTKVINTKAIWICVGLIWIIIGWYSSQKGITDFQLHIVIPFDIFMITFCGIYIVHCLRNSTKINPSSFFLIVYLLMEFCVNLFLDMMSNFLNTYFSDAFMTLLWKEILPIYSVLKISVIVWIILTVRRKLPSLDQMPTF